MKKARLSNLAFFGVFNFVTRIGFCDNCLVFLSFGLGGYEQLPDLWHTFATNALAYGMDIKTLSTILGHVSCATTLNTYSHVTDEMQQRVAVKIDRGIAKAEIKLQEEKPKEHTMTTFQARKQWSRNAS